MKFSVNNFYLNRFGVREELISEAPASELSLIVVIPCCNEPDLNSSLQSLYQCDQPNGNIEVLVVVNASEIASEEILIKNKETVLEGEKWCYHNSQDWIKTFFIEENQLPKKHAGVGLARKIGMDEAVRRFERINKPDGVIVCFDADASCDKNYLVEIENHFVGNQKSSACSIHFEHPLFGDSFSNEIYNGIEDYELHLRYYKNALAYCNLPYAFHTVGSSMAVRSSAYQKQNGMNKRKAGEDFYFLQKMIALGDFTEINSTKVIPSPRTSDRVPFGTGKAMQEIVDSENQNYNIYNIKSFIELRKFTDVIPKLYSSSIIISAPIQGFLDSIDFNENLEKIRENSVNSEHFTKQFYLWFNAFKVLKLVHFLRDEYYADVNAKKAANDLLELMNLQKVEEDELIHIYRKIDKKVI